MKLILFDIDGTLISSGGAGTKAMEMAFEEMFSVRNAFHTVSMAGKTDPQIVREGLMLHGLDHSNGVVPEFLDLYVRHLSRNIKEGRGHVMPGIREALQALRAENKYVIGLLTGNIEKGAAIKLDHFGLSPFFSVGAFGSDDEDRNRLLPLAAEKLRRSQGIGISLSDCVVIGDTPRDVECSKPFGALSIGVATGPYSGKELTEAGADIVFQNLSDTGGLLSAICG